MNSEILLQMVAEALTVFPTTTDAGSRVYVPGDWPTQSDEYPIIRLRLATEDRIPLSRSGAPCFTTTATIQIMGEVSAAAQKDNGGAGAAEAAAWRLKRQIEMAIVNGYPLTSHIQQIASMRSAIEYDSTGSTHLASINIALALEFVEDASDFAPVEADDLDTVEATLTSDPSVGFTARFNQ